MPRKSPKGRGKGAAFEREIAKSLSTWWDSEAQEVFWRSAGSGGRATRSGGCEQYGDIVSVSETGHKLTNKIVIELKKGYGHWSPFDCIDGPSRIFREFMKQVLRDRKKSGRPHFWLIFQRTRRRPCLVTSAAFFSQYYPMALKEDFESYSRIKMDGRILIAVDLQEFVSKCEPDPLKKCMKQSSACELRTVAQKRNRFFRK